FGPDRCRFNEEPLVKALKDVIREAMKIHLWLIPMIMIPITIPYSSSLQRVKTQVAPKSFSDLTDSTKINVLYDKLRERLVLLLPIFHQRGWKFLLQEIGILTVVSGAIIPPKLRYVRPENVGR